MDGAQRTGFKADGGRYMLHSEKTHGLVSFASRKGTRLTLAELHGGSEEGVYIVYNVGDHLHVAPYDATEKEPIKSMVFNPSAVRDGYPCCHAFCVNARDGLDLIVGIANGELLLMSLRAQLQPALSGSTKPALTATLNADNAHDGSRVHAVAWVPRSEGSQFLAAHASGAILVYKKSSAMVGEAGGKFLSGLGGSKGGGLAPVQQIQLGAGAVFDAAFSPNGARLAVACRDGTMRLLDWPSGQCVGGFHSFYGALLCCCWSADGKYVATGGEDDLVTWYSVLDRCQIAWGEGHSSWVSRVAFDAHWQPPEPPAGGQPGAPGVLLSSYRVGSVGQDAALALWDLAVEEDPSYVDKATGQTGMKRVASATLLSNVPTVSSTANLAALADGAAPSGSSQQPQQAPAAGSSQHGGGGAGGGGGHARQPSAGAASVDIAGQRQGSGALVGRPNGSAATIAPSVEQQHMTLLRPAVQHKVHAEPLSDILFTDEAVFTACHGGAIKCWLRPAFVAQLEQQQQQAQQQAQGGGGT